MNGVGTDTVTWSANSSRNLASATPVSQIDIFVDAIQFTTTLRLTGISGEIYDAGVPAVYTVQRYTDGRLLAVNDADRTDIFEDVSTFSPIDHAPLHNYAASEIPTFGDDSSSGYSRGSRWNDGTDEYVCVGCDGWRSGMESGNLGSSVRSL